MPTAKEIKEGLEIMLQYEPNGYCDAHHDVIYGPSQQTGMEYSAEDRSKLEALGWHWDEEAECWAAYT